MNRINTSLLICGAGLLLVLAACSSQKDTIANRKLQNLSARYNLIYNSNVLMDEYLEKINDETPKDFSTVLPIYYAPAMADAQTTAATVKELDEIAKKARTIIAEKGFSNYLDEAYMLLGKTYFYQGRYYNAKEYFDYVARSYKKNHSIYLKALTWKARSLMQIDDPIPLRKTLDTLSRELDSVKKGKTNALATLAQQNLLLSQNKKAIEFLLKALKAGATKSERLNWTYTLAQLYENEQDYTNSLANYAKVVKSNADFEMYFNAKLSSIRINEQLSPHNFDKNAQLLRMLKDEKNTDFRDQIYFELAKHFIEQKNYNLAENYLIKSIRTSSKNKTQKALSYLQIADLNFNQYANYATAKLYYDSASLFFPKSHPLYLSTSAKAKNLTYLQKRYETIALEDTLQKYSRLNENDRLNALNQYFERLTIVEAAKETKPTDESGRSDAPSAGGTTGQPSSFYFANRDALSSGFNEFKHKWGERKLAPYWRNIQQKGKTDNTANDPFSENNLAMGNPDEIPIEKPNSSDKANRYLDSIPQTPEQLEKSNQKIIAAYLDLGSFYQQVLKDEPQTFKTYQTLLNRFPTIKDLDRVYYSLYLAYQNSSPQKATEYKQLVLDRFPESVFAKTILNPNYSVVQNELELKLAREYETIFNLYQAKKYSEVQKEAKNLIQRFPGNKMAAQFDYLSALALGHTAKADLLLVAFKTISSQYKTDKLIKPLVDQHIAFIQKNWSVLKNQKTAILPIDSNEIPFRDKLLIDQPIIANVQNPTGKLSTSPITTPPVVTKESQLPIEKENPKKEDLVAEKPIANQKLTEITPKKTDTLDKVANNKSTTPETPKTASSIKPKSTIVNTDSLAKKPILEKSKPAPIKDNLFNNQPSKIYYYVIAVNSYNVSISSSRFGIGQFNRVNYTGANLRHQLTELEKDQLILVGDFVSPSEVLAYQERIGGQLNNLIKIPSANYSTFVISKENLDKITDRSTLERYKAYINSNEL